jgi:hypothetical protein
MNELNKYKYQSSFNIGEESVLQVKHLSKISALKWT